MFCKQLVVIMIHYWLCHKAFYKATERERGKDHMADEAVNGTLNQGMQAEGEREWGRWCLLLIQNLHTHFHWLTAQYWTITGKTPLFVYLSAGGFSGYWHSNSTITELKHAASSVLLNVRLKWHRHRTISVHFIYKNVLKFSVQRLSNEVQQIMHASLALLYPLLRLDISVLFYFFFPFYFICLFFFAEGEVYKKEKKEVETDLQKNNQGWICNVNLRSVFE